eukprot:TRINITY_DN79599_c0_g1_i1.p1 TRINITY_DN79599_c0_g1~~TRINITY_DN79599_c0_g1_i1.p1  ORF type:complete len:264 (-),score=81.82 TRINITY_DN79599_c0_g1_i1:119-910(-)
MARLARRSSGILLLLVALGAPALIAFTGNAGGALRPRYESSRLSKAAEGKSSAPESVAIIKVTEESIQTTAGVLAGAAGYMFGGVWVAAAAFAATSYIARQKDDDIGAGFKGVAQGALEVINYVGRLDNKFQVTSQVSSKVSESVNVGNAASPVTDAIGSFDKEVSIKDTVGGLLNASGEMASQAVGKVMELNSNLKISDQLGKTASSAAENASSAAEEALKTSGVTVPAMPDLNVTPPSQPKAPKLWSEVEAEMRAKEKQTS